jgi:hypothetical protein
MRATINSRTKGSKSSTIADERLGFGSWADEIRSLRVVCFRLLGDHLQTSTGDRANVLLSGVKRT